MQYSFLRVFANDGTIDAEELAMLEKLALEDGSVDPRERDVLSRIFARVRRRQGVGGRMAARSAASRSGIRFP